MTIKEKAARYDYEKAFEKWEKRIAKLRGNIGNAKLEREERKAWQEVTRTERALLEAMGRGINF